MMKYIQGGRRKNHPGRYPEMDKNNLDDQPGLQQRLEENHDNP